MITNVELTFHAFMGVIQFFFALALLAVFTFGVIGYWSSSAMLVWEEQTSAFPPTFECKYVTGTRSFVEYSYTVRGCPRWQKI